jgi:hypothetical protein
VPGIEQLKTGVLLPHLGRSFSQRKATVHDKMKFSIVICDSSLIFRPAFVDSAEPPAQGKRLRE